MRLTNRERIMLLALLVILVVSGLVYYIYLPAFDNLQAEKMSLQANQKTLNNIERNIMPIEQQRMLIESFRQKVDIMERTLPPVIYQEEVIRSMSNIMDENSLNVLEYEFSATDEQKTESTGEEAIDKILAGYENTVLDNISKGMVEARFENAEQEEGKQEESWEDVVDTIEVTVTLDGEYENIKASIRELENLENLVVVKAMSIAKNTVYENRVIGTIDLVFPYYYDNETLEKIDWLYESDFKEHKPFDYIVTGSLADPDRPVYNRGSSSSISNNLLMPNIGGSDLNSQLDELLTGTQENQALEEDFEIVMSSYASILQRYFIAKSGQKEISLGSDRESEEITLTVSEDQNGFSFNYSNSFNSFPRSSEFYGFTPNYQDAIYMTVVSSPRVDSKDVGSATVNVINKTSKPVKVFVKSDDESRPRFIMGTKDGDVTVVYD